MCLEAQAQEARPVLLLVFYKVVKQVHLDVGISSKAMAIERIEAGKLVRHT